MRISKKILACVLAALMAISMMPITALADITYTADSEPFGYEAFVYNDDPFKSFEAYFEDDYVWTDTLFVLKEDIELSEPLVIPAGSDIQIDLNGHSIIGNVADKMIKNYGTVEFVSFNEPGGHIYNTNTAGQGRDAFTNYGTLTVNADVYFGDADNDLTNDNATTRGAGLRNFGTATINTGHFTNINNAKGVYAYAIINDGNGTVTINNATVYGHNHGNVCNNDGTINIYDGNFSLVKTYNNSDYNLYVCETSVTNVYGGTFSCTGNYAAICVDEEDYVSAAINISGGSFSYDTTVGFKKSNSTNQYVNITGGTFSGDVSAYLADGYSQDANGAVALAGVAKINSTYYATLEAAITAATAGDTITLVADVDVTGYSAETAMARHALDLSDLTLDLNGKTITSYNHSVVYVGDNFTIKNGNMVCLTDPVHSTRPSYAVVIYPEVGNWQTDVVNDWSENVVLENLVCTGGINIFGGKVTVKGEDTVVNGTNYYALWADVKSTLDVEAGTFASASITGGNSVIGSCADSGLEAYVTVKGGNFTVNAGQNLILGNSKVTVKGGSYHYANDDVYTVPVAKLGENCEQNMTTGVVTQSEANSGASVTVAEEISQNLYIDADYYEATYGDDVTVTITYNHASNASETQNFQTETIDFSELPALNDPTSGFNGAKMLSVLQAPAQATEPITIRVYDGGVEIEEEKVEYSVYKYCTAILGYEDAQLGDKAAELKELAETTLDYAAAAQNYFNYNTANMATQGAVGEFYNDVASTTVSAPGFSGYYGQIKGATVVVKSELEINLLTLDPIEVFSGSMPYATNGTEHFGVTKGAKNGSYNVVHIAGIVPANMDEQINVSLNGADFDFTANTIMKLMSNSIDSNMATLAKAMYRYGQAANAYFDE